MGYGVNSASRTAGVRTGWKFLSVAGLVCGLVFTGPIGLPQASAQDSDFRSASLMENESALSKSKSRRDQVARVTLEARRWPLERVLATIAASAREMNIKIAHKDPEKQEELSKMLVTVELTNVNWQTALEYVASKYDFVVDRRMESDGILFLRQPPRVTYTVKAEDNISMMRAIELITKEADADIIAAPDVVNDNRPVVFSFRNLPWEEALDAVLKQYGYVKIVEPSGIVRITSSAQEKLEMRTEMVFLKYISPEGAHFAPEVEGKFFVRMSHGTTTTGTEGSTTSGVGVSVTLLDALRQLASRQGETTVGTVTHEPRTNAIIIRDTATVIEEMKKVINSVDRPPNQVKISCKMIESVFNPEISSGFSWNDGEGFKLKVTGDNAWNTLFPFTTSTNPSTLLSSIPFLRPIDTTGNSYLRALSQGGGGSSEYWDNTTSYTQDSTTTTNIKTAVLSSHMTAQFKDKFSKSKLVQAPELVVLDNTEAVIHIGDIIRYANVERTYDEDTGAVQTETYTEADPLELGVTFVVVPHVCGDTDNIILEVIPKTETLDQAEPWIYYPDEANKVLQLPQTNSKTVVTRMMLKSGETGVIGGLIDTTEAEEKNKIPFIADIPVMGRFFKNTEKGSTNKKENTVIFLTPNIIRVDGRLDFDDELNAIRDMAARVDLEEDMMLDDDDAEDSIE